jgi:hypothetical protein
MARPLHFSPLPHNPAFHSRPLFATAAAGAEFTEAIKSRAENAPTVPRFPENDPNFAACPSPLICIGSGTMANKPKQHGSHRHCARIGHESIFTLTTDPELRTQR